MNATLRFALGITLLYGAGQISPRSAQQGGSPNKTQRRESWRLTTSRSEMTDQRNVTEALRASNSVPGHFGAVTPTWVVRCREGELNVFLNTQMVLDSDLDDNSPVRLRWDQREPMDETWSISSDRSGVFV